MSYLLVTNSSLLEDSSRLTPWLEALDKANISYRGPFDIDSFKQQKPPCEQDCILALGGDGTVSAMAELCVQHNALLGVLPAGTANDFARSLGIVTEPELAVMVIVNGQEQRVDVGRLDSKLFLNVAHIGLGAEVSIHLPRQHKRFWGTFSYLRELLSRLLKRKSFRGRLCFDQRWLYARWLEIAIANGPHFGGGHRIENAGLQSGVLTLVAVRERPIPRLLFAVIAAKLGFPRNPKLLRIERVEEVWLQTHSDLAVTADGESRHPRDLRCRIEPSALKVIYPPLNRA